VASTAYAKVHREHSPFLMNFKAVEWSNKQMFRNEVSTDLAGAALADIWMPPPKNINGIDSINYTREGASQGGLFPNVSTQGFWEEITTLGGLIPAIQDVLGLSEATMAQVAMDESESVFKGAGLREHNYEWNLVTLDEDDAVAIENVTRMFHIWGYPGASWQTTSSRMIHPPMWIINIASPSSAGTASGVGGSGFRAGNVRSEKMSWRWGQNPLLSVLKSVNITTQGAAAGSFAFGSKSNSYPPQVNISLSFIELEPAVRSENNNQLISRSQVRGHEHDGAGGA
jgi:hypothetical protein